MFKTIFLRPESEILSCNVKLSSSFFMGVPKAIQQQTINWLPGYLMVSFAAFLCRDWCNEFTKFVLVFNSFLTLSKPCSWWYSNWGRCIVTRRIQSSHKVKDVIVSTKSIFACIDVRLVVTRLCTFSQGVTAQIYNGEELKRLDFSWNALWNKHGTFSIKCYPSSS